MAKNISRKEFLKATAMSAAGIGLLGAGVLNAKAEEEKPAHKNSSKWVLDSQNVKWDEEHDIVICGYGMAGTAAYIEAYEIDHNVDAVIYDKSDEANAGGQAIASGQCVIFVDPNDLETWRTYMRAMNEPHVIPEEDFNWLTNEFATDLPWIQAVLEPVDYEVGYSGGGALRWGTLLVEFPDLPGANFVGATGHFRDKRSAGISGGAMELQADTGKNEHGGNPGGHLLNGCDRQYSVHCKRAGRDDGASAGLYIRDDAGGLAGGDGAKDGAGHCAT